MHSVINSLNVILTQLLWEGSRLNKTSLTCGGVWEWHHPPAARTEEHPPLSEKMTRSVWAWKTWPGPHWKPNPALKLPPLSDNSVHTNGEISVTCAGVELTPRNKFRWTCETLCVAPLKAFLFPHWGQQKVGQLRNTERESCLPTFLHNKPTPDKRNLRNTPW